MDVQKVAEVKAAAGMSVATASAALSWIAEAHEVLQFFTALVALGVAVLTARFYWVRTQMMLAEDRRAQEKHDRKTQGDNDATD